MQHRNPKTVSLTQHFIDLHQSPIKLCHPERSITIGEANRNAKSRDLLFACAMKTHCYSVYIIASKSRAFYIGMTNDLGRRTFEHKNDLIEGFSKKYRCHRLVYYESFDDVNKAIDRLPFKFPVPMRAHMIV